jgi:hypothetical protein
VRILTCIALVTLLAACTGTGGTAESDPAVRAPEPQRLTHTAEEAEEFFRRFTFLRAPLQNYVDPTKVEYVSREFSAETVLFRLDNTGDSGPLYHAALDRAVELMEQNGWPEEELINMPVREAHAALVSVESIGIPAGATAGSRIPVRIRPLGNATDIHGGYVYNTPLRNRQGRTVALLRQGYLPFDLTRVNPEDITEEMRADAGKLERREGALRTTYILRDAVVLAANVRSDDLTAEQIILDLTRTITSNDKVREVSALSAELLPDVMRSIETQMEEAGIPVKVESQARKLIITPLGVRELTLRQISERILSLSVEIRPRNQVLIVADDHEGRMAFYGPLQHRFLLGDVNLIVDRAVRAAREQPELLPFRVSCQVLERAQPGRSRSFGMATEDLPHPDGHPGRVRLAWSRWDGRGRMIEQSEENLETSDISEILRHLWTRGMGPVEALCFVFEAKEQLAIAAELGYSYRRFDPEQATEGRQN